MGIKRIFGVSLLVPAVLLFAGCGGGTKTVTEGATSTAATTTTSGLTPVQGPLSAQSVKSCLQEGGAVVTSTSSISANTPAVFAYGPDGGRIGIALVNNAYLSRIVANQLAKQGQYEVNKGADGKTLVLFDHQATDADQALAAKCVTPGGG